MIQLLYHPPYLHFCFSSEDINHGYIIGTLNPNQVCYPIFGDNQRLKPPSVSVMSPCSSSGCY